MKKSFIFLLIGIFLISLSPLVSSANVLTVVAPAQNGRVNTATYTLNATFDSTDKNPTNMTFYYCTGACASWTTIGTTENVSTNQISFNYTWDTTAIDDINNIVVNGTAKNLTSEIITSDNSTGVDIDNGSPTATISSATMHDDYRIRAGETFNFGLDADDTIGISSCLIYLTDVMNSTVYSATSTASANACSNATIYPGILIIGKQYNVLTQATDGNGNRTNSSTRLLRYITADTGSSAGVTNQQGVLQSIVSGGEGGFFASVGNFFKSIGSFFSNLWNKIF